MKKIYRIILTYFLIFIYLSGCSEKSLNSDLETNKNTDIETNNLMIDEEIETYIIETKNVDMKYPKRWEDKVSIENPKENCIRFVADGIAIFDIFLNSDEGEVLGTLNKPEVNLVLSVKMYELDSENENYNDHLIMQEDINVILENLGKDYNFVVGSVVDLENNEVFEIETKYVNLHYPIKWREKISVDVNGEKVCFSSNGVVLFEIMFNANVGDLLGTYNNVKINLICYDIEQKNLSDKEYLELIAMQEDLNVILEKLCEDENFSINIG